MSERKRPVDQLLDLFVYAPLGLVLNLDEVVPQLIEKGHQQVNMARMFGQFAVQTGTQEVKKRVERMADRSAPTTSGRGESPASASATTSSTADEATAPVAAPPPAPPDGEAAPGVEELAIPDYDSLAASQVVPRLDGLSAAERDAVRRYETAHRHRKTILSKLAQLG